MSSLKVHELLVECQKRGIAIDPNTSYKSQDYIRLLGEHTLKDRYKSLDQVPFYLKYRFDLISPMLSKLFKDIKPSLQQEILKNKTGRWIAEHKYGGSRSIMVYDPLSGFHFFSREVSTVDFLPIEYTDKILFIKDGKLTKPEQFKGKFPKPFVLDIEILLPDTVDKSYFLKLNSNPYATIDPVTVLFSMDDIDTCHEIQVTEAPLSFVVFDILYYGQDIKNLPLEKRKSVQEQLVTRLSNYYLPFQNSKVFNSDFLGVYNRYLESGGEGLILKNLDKPYLATKGRQSDVQVKFKKGMLGVLREERDFDVFISSYVAPKKSTSKDQELNNLISEINCSIYIKKPNGDEIEHEVCSIHNIPIEVSKKITKYDTTGKAILNPDIKDKVITVVGQGITPSLKFEHTFCDEWSFQKDKTKYDCLINEMDLVRIFR